MELKDKIKSIPQTPGVYMMKDSKNEVIYVGKAKNLRNRVRSYFQVNPDERLYSPYLIKRVADIDFLVTDTEKEALILENNLIKQFRPRFNVNLRDDKTFVSIKLDLDSPFPYLKMVRQIDRDGALYFGPYSSAKSARETLRYINELFPIRKCSDNVFKNRVRPCLHYQLGRCLGPCCNLVDKESYKELIDEIILILKGKNDDLIKMLREKMVTASRLLRYEEAAKIRDRIAAIEKTVERQKIHTMNFIDRDIFGYKADEKEIYIQAMFIRSGNLTDVASYCFPTRYNSAEKNFCSFLNQFYGNNKFVPKEVIVPVETEDKEVLEELLTELKGQKVAVIIPQRGERFRLMQMAERNAETALHSRGGQDKENGILNDLARALHLQNLPEKIECFDVSNICGEHAVGAMVVFKGGIPYKPGYRRYRIKDVTISGDIGMIKEILKRRYTRALKQNDLPDLTIIDGGKGHLSVAMDVFKELGVQGVDVMSIAKGKRQDNITDHVFLPDEAVPIILKTGSPALLIIQRIRDEAHRFAITYHKKIRQREIFVPSFKSKVTTL